MFWSHTELFDLFHVFNLMFHQLSTSFSSQIQTTHPHPNLTSPTNLYVSSINGKDHFHPLNPHNSFPLFFHWMFHFLLVMDREEWRAAVHGGRKELDTTERLNWTELHADSDYYTKLHCLPSHAKYTTVFICVLFPWGTEENNRSVPYSCLFVPPQPTLYSSSLI